MPESVGRHGLAGDLQSVSQLKVHGGHGGHGRHGGHGAVVQDHVWDLQSVSQLKVQ